MLIFLSFGSLILAGIIVLGFYSLISLLGISIKRVVSRLINIEEVDA
jgi:hypothetical protein